jgi:hypothetical protein
MGGLSSFDDVTARGCAAFQMRRAKGPLLRLWVPVLVTR